MLYRYKYKISLYILFYHINEFPQIQNLKSFMQQKIIGTISMSFLSQSECFERELLSKINNEYRLLKLLIDNKYKNQFEELERLRQNEKKLKLKGEKARLNESKKRLDKLAKEIADNVETLLLSNIINYNELKGLYQKLIRICEHGGVLDENDQASIVPYYMNLEEICSFLKKCELKAKPIKFKYNNEYIVLGLYLKNVTCVHKSLMNKSKLFHAPINMYKSQNPNKPYNHILKNKEGYHMYLLKNLPYGLYFDGCYLLEKNTHESNFQKKAEDGFCYVCNIQFSLFFPKLRVNCFHKKIYVCSSSSCHDKLGILWMPLKYQSDYLFK